MEQHVRLVVLKHLGDEFDIHVLNVNFLCEHLSKRVSLKWNQHRAIPEGFCSSRQRPRSVSPVFQLIRRALYTAVGSIPRW